ncbi:TPA: hypothetical protein ACIT4B_003916 [Salmonella enterica subsp. enterica serovar Java]|nr:hypothetical protein [Salmonella enterica subsp. enterica serovar 4,[5],12:b:-]EGZ8789189.1 hypothetical protein [Salmonella enterica subsp. enterica serovar 4,[5],12:b:-]EHA0615839.1 hypothetical protein [Salmonella enterica subsp. enterica serovar 4,[5],12:b:-]
MKKVFVVISLILGLVGCDVKNTSTEITDKTPDYVQDAKSNLGNAILANIIRNPDFKCHSLFLDSLSQWALGCFEPTEHPLPFLLYEVREDTSGDNPPFKYKLIAINGKAKQYAENPSLRFLKIATKTNSDIDIDSAINEFVKAYPPN